MWTISSAKASERRQIISIGNKAMKEKKVGGIMKLCKFIAGELGIHGYDGGVEG